MSTITHCIPESHIKNLHKYTYSGVDRSIMSHLFLNRFWNFAVTLVPLNVAPNLVTAVGFLAIIGSFALTMYHFFVVGHFPAYVWLVDAAAVFWYSTLDAIDGKHARRTFTQSPLGELFDHGCDALTTPLLCTMACLMVGGSPDECLVLFFSLCFGCVLCIWEQYCTGTLDLWYVNGPVEGTYLEMACFLVAYAKGVAWWSIPFAGGPLVLYKGVVEIGCIRETLIYLIVFGGIGQSISSIRNVLTLPRKHSNVNCALPLIMFGILFAAIFAARAPLIALQRELPFALELGFGFLVSFYCTSMTVARMTFFDFAKMSHVPYCVCMSFVMCVGFVMSNSAHLPEFVRNMSRAERLDTFHIHQLAWALPAFLLVFYLIFLFGAFFQTAAFFKINLLTMTEAQHKKIRDAGLHGNKTAAAPAATAATASPKKVSTPRRGRSRSRTPNKKKCLRNTTEDWARQLHFSVDSFFPQGK